MKTIKIEDSTHQALKVFCAKNNRNMTVMADYAILDAIEMEGQRLAKKSAKEKISSKIKALKK